jgi:glycosyltransferase involved in cell wall biosynthesis
MRIAIDYTTAIAQRAGVGRYVRSLVDAMIEQDHSNHYLLLACGRPTSEYQFPIADNVRSRTIFLPDRYWFRWQLPFYSTHFSGQVDVYHGPNFALPSLKGKLSKVVTIHDLSYLKYPQYGAPETIAYLNKVVAKSVAAADLVATVSQETRRTLIEHYKMPPQKIVVIPAGVEAHFRRITDPELLEATRQKFDLNQPFILSVGTLEPRKNHLGLIKAFYQLQGRKGVPTMLVLAGGKGWLYEETRSMVAKLKLEDKVRFLGYVSELELTALYSMADVFVFPSFFEGFGIPPLEAMACGAPVITSNTSSLPEVVGDAAILIDPHDTNALANAITRLLEDEQLQEDLRQKGYQQVQRYTWSIAANKMLSVYHKLFNGIARFADEDELL